MKKTIIIVFGLLLFSLQAVCQTDSIARKTHLEKDTTIKRSGLRDYPCDCNTYVIDGYKLNDSVFYTMTDLYSPFPDFGYIFYTVPRSTRKDISHFTEYGYHYSSQDIRNMANWTDLLGEKL